MPRDIVKEPIKNQRITKELLIVENILMGIGNCKEKDIVIPNNVTRVNANAFKYNTSIKSIVFSNNTTEIGDYAFDGCNRLDYVVIPNTLCRIGKAAFRNCGKMTIIFKGTKDEWDNVSKAKRVGFLGMVERRVFHQVKMNNIHNWDYGCYWIVQCTDGNKKIML